MVYSKGIALFLRSDRAAMVSVLTGGCGLQSWKVLVCVLLGGLKEPLNRAAMDQRVHHAARPVFLCLTSNPHGSLWLVK